MDHHFRHKSADTQLFALDSGVAAPPCIRELRGNRVVPHWQAGLYQAHEHRFFPARRLSFPARPF